MTPEQQRCEHLNYSADVKVNRVLNDITKKLGATTLTVKCVCQDCGLPFWFPGLATGVSYKTAVTDVSGFEMTTPICPAGRRHQPDGSFVAVEVRTNDSLKGQDRS